MTKNSLGLVLIIAAAAALSGCHGSAWDCGPKPTIVEEVAPPQPEPEPPAPVKACAEQPVEVRFEFDRTELDSKGMSDLDSLAACLANNPTQTIKIAGHADSWGSVPYNQTLSEKRAGVVKSYMLSKGVAETHITEVMGYGETQLQDPTAKTKEQNEVNRRAIVTVFQ